MTVLFVLSSNIPVNMETHNRCFNTEKYPTDPYVAIVESMVVIVGRL